MTRAGRAATLSSFLLGALAMACTAGEAERNEPLAQRDEPVASANESRAAQSERRGREKGEEARAIGDRVREPESGLTLPRDFHGTWAASLDECRGGGWVQIGPGGFRSPDNIAALLEPARIVRQVTPDGEAAATITPRVEQMSEGEPGVGRVRISRAGEHLYMSNADIVGEAEHWRMRNVRCPNPGYGEAE